MEDYVPVPYYETVVVPGFASKSLFRKKSNEVRTIVTLKSTHTKAISGFLRSGVLLGFPGKNALSF